MTLAEKISTERKRKGLSQEELADQAQVSLRTIQRIEREESVPRGFTLNAIAQALGKPIEELSTISAELIVKEADLPVELFIEVPQETTTLPLQQLNLAAFSFLLFPYLGFLLPLTLRKRQNTTSEQKAIGARIINFQIAWCICFHLGLLLALGVQLICAYYFQVKLGFLVMGTFFFFYLLNIVAILEAAIRLRKGDLHVYPRWKNLFL